MSRSIRTLRPLRLARALALRFWPLARHRCPLCERRSGGFLPYPDQPRLPLMDVLDVVGSNLRTYECPWCGCHDRERHVFLYMQASGLLDELASRRVLHFAPEKRLAQRIEAARPQQYQRCDLFPQAPEVMRVDMLQMPFAADSFDLLIANHVLEHVADPERALREIGRVLAPGGLAILQTPYSARLQHSWEDPGIDSDSARLQAYGQADHVRLFGRDLFARLAAQGLEDCSSSHAELLGDVDAGVVGVNSCEPFFLFRKPSSTSAALDDAFF